MNNLNSIALSLTKPIAKRWYRIAQTAKAAEAYVARKISDNSALLMDLARGWDVTHSIIESGSDLGFTIVMLSLAKYEPIKFKALPFSHALLGESIRYGKNTESLNFLEDHPGINLSGIAARRFVEFRYSIRKFIRREPLIFIVLPALLKEANSEQKFINSCRWILEIIDASGKSISPSAIQHGLQHD